MKKKIHQSLKRENKTIRINKIEANLVETFGNGKNFGEKIRFLAMKGIEKLESEGKIKILNESTGTPFENVLDSLGRNLVDYEVNKDAEKARFIVTNLDSVSQDVFAIVNIYGWEIVEAE